MTRYKAIELELVALNKGTGALLRESAEMLEPRLTSAQFDAWAEIAGDIARSGWHAFESANVYLAQSPELERRHGSNLLLHCGQYGRALCGHSFEPSATYFRGVTGLLAQDSMAILPLIERAGSAISERYAQASNLITDYFRISFALGARTSVDQLQEWSDLAIIMAESERSALAAFLDDSETEADIDWRYVRRLSRQSMRASADYLAVVGTLARLLGPLEQERVKGLITRYARPDEDLSDWLVALLATLKGLPPAHRGLLVALLSELPDKVLATSLMSTAGDLPWHRPDALGTWIKRVHDYLPLNVNGAAGFLAMESAKSQRLLESLLGQVNLEDCQRVLQLFSEAMTGKRLAIEQHKDQVRSIRDLPGTDGQSVFLPATISHYAETERNFSLYKISLLHQLGYYEFGTFEFLGRSQLSTFGKHFEQFPNPALAAALFQVLEDARIDWAIERCYRGVRPALTQLKADALEIVPADARSDTHACLLALQRFSLDGSLRESDGEIPQVEGLFELIGWLRAESADVFTTMEVLAACYELIEETGEAHSADAKPDPVNFRGELEPDRVMANIQLVPLEDEDIPVDDKEKEDSLALTSMVNPKDIKIEQLKKGDVGDGMTITMTDVDVPDAEDEDAEPEPGSESVAPPPAAKRDDPLAYRYDEWDSVIGDYRRRWCTLYEVRDIDEQPAFVEDTLRSLRGVANNVRRQLSHLRPELLRKVKGVSDGEELDLEKTIESIVDRLAGLTPDERIYVQRQRRDRDVSTLFLLDMSASTDDRIASPGEDKPKAPAIDPDNFLHDFYGVKPEPDTRKRIIDVEKEAVVLMAEALERLGDSYSVCGFSGYGKDQVDFYLCKDFDEAYNIRAKGRIGGIKPCRSTRMGPAIRHATKRLVATESRIKALIIISDGYPQDFDYGKDRNSKDYGIKDTTMALTEAKQKGVQAFCLTVDPSGHDYLREMCPDQQYMVIQDVAQLPSELSKVYRSLTA